MNHYASKPRARRGFTLIEILVVISIIALLSAIIFPVFGRVREGGRRTACNSNMRQLGLAFQQYVADNRRYPYAGNYQAWGPGLGHWVAGVRAANGGGLAGDTAPFTRNPNATANVEAGALYQYVRSAASYVCPSTQDSREKRLGYSMNCAVAALSEPRLRTPSEIILLVDEGKTLNDGYFWAVGGAPNTDELTRAHNGDGNILFCDGHVKFYPFESLPLDKDADVLKTRVTGVPRFRDRAFGGAVGTPGEGTSQAGSAATPTATINPRASTTDDDSTCFPVSATTTP